MEYLIQEDTVWLPGESLKALHMRPLSMSRHQLEHSKGYPSMGGRH